MPELPGYRQREPALVVILTTGALATGGRTSDSFAHAKPVPVPQPRSAPPSPRAGKAGLRRIPRRHVADTINDSSAHYARRLRALRLSGDGQKRTRDVDVPDEGEKSRLRLHLLCIALSSSCHSERPEMTPLPSAEALSAAAGEESRILSSS